MRNPVQLIQAVKIIKVDLKWALMIFLPIQREQIKSLRLN